MSFYGIYCLSDKKVLLSQAKLIVYRLSLVTAKLIYKKHQPKAYYQPNKTMRLNPLEKHAALSLAGIYGLRMFGLFLVLPVLAILAQDLPGYSLSLVGIAIGVYGLGQALLQIPLGMLSDHIGRKPVIILGLLMFFSGSLIAANAESIYGLIAGRALQGAGAIASTLMAFAADLSRPEMRSKMMAVIGATIGASFILALILGPWLAQLIGLSGLFYLTAVLAILAILLVLKIKVKPADDTASKIEQDSEIEALASQSALPLSQQLIEVFANSQLLALNAGIFILHMLLTGVFVIIPGLLTDYQLPLERQSLAYLLLMVAGFVVMLPGLKLVERYKAHKLGFSSAIGILVIAMLLLSMQTSLSQTLLALGLFFLSFNFLEASLPALLSRLCAGHNRGTSMGVYSTCQFLGAFAGGGLAGYLADQYAPNNLFYVFAGATVIWLVINFVIPFKGLYNDEHH
jgi:MFS family permease